jgi:hypothetical protein
MTNECMIGWDNRIDAALLTGNVTASVQNLKTEDVRHVWRGDETTPHILADFGSQIEVGATALMNFNALADDGVRVRLSTIDATGVAGDAYDSGTSFIPTAVDPAFRIFLHVLPTPAIGRYLRLNFTLASIPEAGRWFAGPAWLPSRSFSFGWRPPWRDASRRAESLGQVIYIDRKIRQRGMQFSLRGITETEWATQVNEINRICGTSRDILICKDIANSNLGRVTIWGLLEQPVDASQPEQSTDFWVADFEAWERV